MRTGKFGPDLTHLMSRETIAAGAALNNRENLRLWVKDPDAIKPGCADARHATERAGPGRSHRLSAELALTTWGPTDVKRRVGSETNGGLARAARHARPLFDQVHEWIVTVDHKKLGLMYIVYGILFLVIGGVEATVMRIQLAIPQQPFRLARRPSTSMFTMHGTTMIFLVGHADLFGFANYLVPLMIGARDMAFPRLNAFSFWMSALGGIILYFSFIGGSGLYGAGSAPDVGWFAYAPLTSQAFSPGHSTDYWIIGLLVSGVGSIGTALNIVTTILCMRCPGMTLGRMPLLAWLNLVMSATGADRRFRR